MIITISGKAKHGKDTLAGMLKEKLEGDGKKVLVVHFADYLKFICKQYFGWDGEKDEAGRTILQQVGTNIFRERCPDFWVRAVINLLEVIYQDYDHIIIPDTRFPNEITLLQERWHVLTLYVIRVKGLEPFDNGLTDEQKNHPSETALDHYPCDRYIFNRDNRLSYMDRQANEIVQYNLGEYEYECR